jgi:hypothetical protein
MKPSATRPADFAASRTPKPEGLPGTHRIWQSPAGDCGARENLDASTGRPEQRSLREYRCEAVFW